MRWARLTDRVKGRGRQLQPNLARDVQLSPNYKPNVEILDKFQPPCCVQYIIHQFFILVLYTMYGSVTIHHLKSPVYSNEQVTFIVVVWS